MLYIYNIVTGEEILGKTQVLPLLHISILGHQHIAQHCIRQHFCFVTLHLVYPLKMLIQSMHGYPTIKPLTLHLISMSKYRTYNHLKKPNEGCVPRTLTTFHSAWTKKEVCYLQDATSTTKEKHLGSDMIWWGLTQHY